VLPTLDCDILQTFCSQPVYSRIDLLAKMSPDRVNLAMECVEFKFVSKSIFELGNKFNVASTGSVSILIKCQTNLEKAASNPISIAQMSPTDRAHRLKGDKRNRDPYLILCASGPKILHTE